MFHLSASCFSYSLLYVTHFFHTYLFCSLYFHIYFFESSLLSNPEIELCYLFFSFAFIFFNFVMFFISIPRICEPVKLEVGYFSVIFKFLNILIVHTCPLPLWIHYNRVFGMNKWSNFRFWPVGCIWRKKISFAFEKQINFLLLKIALFLYLILKKKWKKVFRFCSHRFICT